jgi:uncharacterized delta-60 repeat protein
MSNGSSERRCRNSRQSRAVIAALEARRSLTAATVDRAFAPLDRLVINFPDTVRGEFADTATLPDGRVYLLGSGVLARLRADGTPDPTFSGDGFAMVGTGADLAVRPGGGVLVAGTSSRQVAVYALNEDGAVDSSFGTNGVTILPKQSSLGEKVTDIQLLNDGEIIVAGSTDNGNRSRGLLVRFTATGQLDTAGGAGNAILITEMSSPGTTFPLLSGGFYKTVPVDGGDYLVFGSGSIASPSAGSANVSRFHADGSPVTTFGVNGRIDVVSGYSRGEFFTLPDHTLLMVGGGNGGGTIGVVKYNPDTGAATPSPGFTTVAIDPSMTAPFDYDIDSDGNLLVAYATAAPGAKIARLSPAMSVLNTVSIDSTTAPPGFATPVLRIAPLPGGQVLAIGSNTSVPNNNLFMVSRYTMFDSSLSVSNAVDGQLLVRMPDGDQQLSLAVVGSELTINDGTQTNAYSLAGRTRIVVADGGGDDTINVGDLSGMTIDIDGGGGNDLTRISSTANVGALRIFGGNGDDRVERSSAAMTASLSFTGDAGTDTLAMIGTAGPDTFVIDDASLAGATYPVRVTTVESWQVSGGDGDDGVDAVRIPVGVSIDVDGGGDADTIIYRGQGDTSNVPVSATLRGGGSDDTIVSYGGKRAVSVEGGAGNDWLRFVAEGGSENVRILATTITHVDGGSRTLTLAPSAIERVSFDAPAGSTGNALTLDDSAATVGQNYSVTNTNLTRAALQFAVDYSGISTVTITPGSGDDTVTSTAAPDVVRVAITASGGTDRLLVDRTTDPRPSTYVIDGGQYTGYGAPSAIAFVEFATLLGGSGDDLVKITAKTNNSLTWTLDGGAGNDQLDVAIAGASNPTKTIDSPGNGRVTFGNRATIEFRSMELINLVPPKILAGVFAPSPETIAITLDFPSTALPLHPSTSVIELTNLSTGKIYTSAELATSTGAGSITLALSGGPINLGGSGSSINLFPGGNYRLVVHGAGLSDAAGNKFGNDLTTEFFVLAGDANRDRQVDFADLVVLAQNYGAFSSIFNNSLNRGDFNHDGKIDFADLTILAQQYGSTLPALPLLVTRTSLIGTTRKPSDRLPDALPV